MAVVAATLAHHRHTHGHGHSRFTTRKSRHTTMMHKEDSLNVPLASRITPASRNASGNHYHEPVVDLNGDGVIDEHDQPRVLAKGRTCAFIGEGNVIVCQITGDREKGEQQASAEELGLQKKWFDEVEQAHHLPQASMGIVKDVDHANREAFVRFEIGVSAWVSFDYLEGMPDMGRQLLLEVVTEYTNRHDAFITLPNTMVYICIFVFLVTGHLRIWDRMQMESALEDWVNGRNPLTSCENNVDDIDSFWEWLQSDSGLEGILATTKNSTVDPALTQQFVASRMIVIGDIMVEAEKFTGEREKSWLLHSDVGSKWLEEHPKDYVGAAKAAAAYLADTGWQDQDISKLWIQFIAYSEYSRMFSKTEVYVRLLHLGAVVPKINADAVSIIPYDDYLLYFWDGLYFILVLRMLKHEGRDALDTLRMGIGEFFDYWTFWNCVDWFSISLGVAFIINWVCVIIWMHSKSLHVILNDDLKINKDVMALDSSDIEDMANAVEGLRIIFFSLHVVMAANTVSIVAKFFKAFTSNPRLTVVTDTFRHAMHDFAHFGIIFTTIFMPFAIIGHVLFGNDIEEFSSLFAAVNTSWLVLLGEFGWYVDATAGGNETGVMPSGMPIFVLFIWYSIYMFLVFLVLLNMLLAIIIEHYTEVTNHLKDLGDVPTLWEQASQYRKFINDTKTFIALEDIKGLLENDGDLAHPDFCVSEKTLLQAFEPIGMTEENARWLYQTLKEELNKKLQRGSLYEGQHEAQLPRSPAQSEMYKSVEEVNIFNVSADKDSTEIKATLNDVPKRLEENRKAIEAMLSDLPRRLEENKRAIEAFTSIFEEKIAKVQRDQARLGKRMDEMAAMLPGAEDNGSPRVRDLAAKMRDRSRQKPKRRNQDDDVAGGGTKESSSLPTLPRAGSIPSPRR